MSYGIKSYRSLQMVQLVTAGAFVHSEWLNGSILCVALSGCFISISTRDSDCERNLSTSVWGARSFCVCQLPSVHFISQTAHSSAFATRDGNHTTRATPALAFTIVPHKKRSVNWAPNRWPSRGGRVFTVCVQACKHDTPQGLDQIFAAELTLSWQTRSQQR